MPANRHSLLSVNARQILADIGAVFRKATRT
jgi:hypothetical protein